MCADLPLSRWSITLAVGVPLNHSDLLRGNCPLDVLVCVALTSKAMYNLEGVFTHVLLELVNIDFHCHSLYGFKMCADSLSFVSLRLRFHRLFHCFSPFFTPERNFWTRSENSLRSHWKFCHLILFTPPALLPHALPSLSVLVLVTPL